MNEEQTHNQTWNSELSQRAGRLSERGAHYFVGWLIAAGADKPEIAEVFEKVLRRMETSPGLSYCWRDGETIEGGAEAAELAVLAIHNEPVPEVDPSQTLLRFQSAPEVPVASGVMPDAGKAEASEDCPTGFFGRLFRRQRIAA